ncbi:hypothetical protein ACHQM5_000475 [Ranunculus cassubicifolius]
MREGLLLQSCLKLLLSSERKEVQFDGEGLPIGPNAASFITFGTYNIDRKRRKDVLLKANTSWKNWKFRIRLRYDEYTTDAERKLNPPKGVKPEDWETIIRKCSTEAEKCKRAQGVAARKQVKLLHTSGRRGAARTKQDLLKQSTTGMVTRTQLFVALHTPKDGSCSHPDTRITLDKIDLLLDLDPSMDEEDLDNDPVGVVCGHDGNGRVRGYSNGVTKTVLEAAAPYKKIAECEKRKREDTNAKYDSLSQRLDEESAARKSLEEKLSHNPTSSTFVNYDQIKSYRCFIQNLGCSCMTV